jgi:hypothetical protein
MKAALNAWSRFLRVGEELPVAGQHGTSTLPVDTDFFPEAVDPTLEIKIVPAVSVFVHQLANLVPVGQFAKLVVRYNSHKSVLSGSTE